jgi:hypothetical protein
MGHSKFPHYNSSPTLFRVFGIVAAYTVAEVMLSAMKVSFEF